MTVITITRLRLFPVTGADFRFRTIGLNTWARYLVQSLVEDVPEQPLE
jgi:hypothetical protein